MKICLISVNSRYSHMNPALYSIYHFLEKNLKKSIFDAWEFKILEFNLNQNISEVKHILFEEAADIYAFSVYIWNVRYIHSILEYLHKTRAKSIFLAGGPEIQYDYQEEYQSQNAWDYIFPGDGELEFLSLLSLSEKKDIRDILEEKKQEDLKYEANAHPKRMRLPAEFLSFYFPHLGTSFENKLVHYESSRGCPFRCSYCVSSLEGKPDLKPLEQVYEELDYFINNDFKIIKFLDRSFNFPSERAEAIWQYLIKQSEMIGLDKMPRFHFELEASLLTKESVNILVNAPKDLFQFEVGIQSIHEKTLRLVDRHPLKEEHFGFIKDIMDADKQHMHLDLIAGLPEETLEMLEESYNFLWSIKPQMLQLGHLKLLRGTPLKEEAIRRGYQFNEHAPYEVYASDAMRPEDFIIVNQVAEMTSKYLDEGLLRETLSRFQDHVQRSAFRIMFEISEVYNAWRGSALRFLAKDEQYFVFLEYLYSQGDAIFEAIVPIFFDEYYTFKKAGSLAFDKVSQKLFDSGRIDLGLYNKLKEYNND